MVHVTCDGCLDELDLSEGFIGVDLYETPDEDDDEEESPVNDEDYGLHFHGWRCVWAYTARQVLDED